MKTKLFILLLSLALAFTAAAQRINADSLVALLPGMPADSSKVKLLNRITEAWTDKKPQQAMEHCKAAIELGKKTGAKKLLAKALSNAGIISYNQGNYDESVKHHSEALEIAEATADKTEIANCNHHLGTIYYRKSAYDKALSYHLKAYKIRAEMNDKEGLAKTYNNFGVIYNSQKDFKNALINHKQALQLREELGDTMGIAMSCNNIGNVYEGQNNLEKALEYYRAALKAAGQINVKGGMGFIMNNIGSICMKQEKYREAIDYFSKALAVRREINDRNGIASSLSGLANVYLKLNDHGKGFQYLEESLKIAKEIGIKQHERSIYRKFSDEHMRLGNYQQALAYLQLHEQLLDSLQGVENSSNVAELKALYETEKKDKEIQLLSKDKEMQASALKRQTFISYAVSGGLLLAGFLAFFAFRGYRQKQRANLRLESAYTIIEEKNRIVEEKNKDITDSINYARKIQTAILPSLENIRNAFPGSFVLYKPKDIVSGDFYWFAERKGQVFIAAADCTGHGVPGAFMSMVGIDLLNQIVIEKGITAPGEILTLLDEGVRSALKQDVSDSSTRDGMDIALIRIDTGGSAEYAGANRPLWIIRSEKENSDEPSLTEVKPDKMPIGGIQAEEKRRFTNHHVQLHPSDTIHIFSDGYADQFGGADGKKFMTKKMKDLLLSISGKSMDEQKQLLDRTIEEWKGNLEQVDDILMIGIRI